MAPSSDRAVSCLTMMCGMSGKHGGLDSDRKNESAAAQPALATALLKVAVDKTSA